MRPRPHAENLFDLAVALRRPGRPPKAKQAFAEFERKSLAETDKRTIQTTN